LDSPIRKTRISLLNNVVKGAKGKRAGPTPYATTTTDLNGNFVFKLRTMLQPNEPLKITRAFDYNTTLSELTANSQGSFAANEKVPIAVPVPWPTIASISPDTGVSSTDGITSATSVTVSGTGLSGATVKVFVDGVAVGTAKIGSDGKWSFKTATLKNGKHVLTATVNDGEQGMFQA
jgi:hypothetical protein